MSEVPRPPWKSDGKPVVIKTPAEYAAEANGAEGGIVCPGCGSVLFAYRTETLRTRIIRYEACHNPVCKRKFQTRQLHREIIREVKPDEFSSSGNDNVNATKKSPKI